MQKIIGIGNSLVDILARVSSDGVLEEMNLPKGSMQLIDSEGLALISKKMRMLEQTRAAGGSASNTMKALSRMGLEAGFIGKIANDEYGRFFRSELEASGIHTALIRKQSGSTGIASTFITPDGQRTFATYLGVSAELCAADITAESLNGYDVLYVEGYLVQNHELMERVMGLAHRRRMVICLDLASFNVVEGDRDFFHSLLARYVDIVFANEEESRAFTGKEPREAAREMGQLCQVAVVKMGALGSCVFSGGQLVEVEAEKVDHVADTTGAGDYFAAGFLYGIVRGQAPEECLRLGSRLAAAVIRVVGATLHADDWSRLKLKV